MFGFLRLLLALLVVASHVAIAHQLDLGNSAVTVFFLLSGYVMTAMIRRYYAELPNYGSFLVERAARIFPQYLFWIMACILWTLLFDNSWQPIGSRQIIENILLVPGMYGVFDLRPWLTGVRYISQTWSLSLEWHFYMILPFLILIRGARLVAFVLSIFIFSLATLGIISPYIFAYHLLPGVLFIFVLGSIAYDNLNTDLSPSRLWIPFTYLILIGIGANARETLHMGYTAEVYIGILVGMPAIYWLARLPSHKFDVWAGNLSYGVFLCHNLVLEMLNKVGYFNNRWAILFWVCVISMVLSAVSFMLSERPLLAWRHSLRNRKKSLS